jgi:superfamily I DNA and/or RNA helicase
VEEKSQTTDVKTISASPSVLELIGQFQSALSEETEVLRIGQKRLIEIFDGEKIGSVSGRYVYRFQGGDLSSWRRRKRGTQITVTTSGIPVQAVIDTWNRKEARLAFEKDLGENIEKAVIEDSAIELLINLNDKLEKIKTDGDKFNVEGSMKLFGFLQPHQFLAPIPLGSRNDGFPLNVEQERAILTAMSQEVTFIWGPPGTGKTKTLTAILKNFIRDQKRVLLAAHTNRAVDEILKKFVEDDNNAALIEEGKIVRLGLPDDEDESLNCVTIEKVAEKRAIKINENIDSLTCQIESLQKKIKNFRQTEESNQKRISDRERILQVQEQIRQEIISLTNRSISVNADITYNDAVLLEKKNLLEKAKTANALRRLFSSVNKQELEAEMAPIVNKQEILKLEFESLKNQISEKNKEESTISKELSQYQQEIDPAIDGLTTISALHNKIQTLQGEIEKKNKDLTQLHLELAKVNDVVFNDAFVVGATLTRATLDTKVTNRKFDVLVVDEASMAPLPNLFFLASVCSSHYIISGDFRQLSPIAQSKGRFSQQWLRRDIFDQAGIVKSVNDGILDDARLVMLREQFRMHPAISNLVSNTVYERKLRTPESVSIKRQNLANMSPFQGQAVILCDTACVDPLITVPENTFSRMSPYSAAFCTRLAVQCLEEAKKSGQELTIGIITPYREQAKLLSKILEDNGVEPDRCVASTVHRFQGAEKDIIIFDLVEGIPLKPGKLIIGGFKDSEAGKLITVAISRAKGKFILVANSEYVKSEFSLNHAMRQLLHIISYWRDSREIELSFAEGINVNSTKLIDASFNLLDTNEFYHSFKRDLNSAKSRIVIFSPFVSKKRVDDLAADFINALSRGVQITVIVRNPELSKAYRKENIETLLELSRMGVNVIPAYKGLGVDENIEKFHFKVAIVDNLALYYGSLNILSQMDSAESMMVFRSKKAITQLSRAFNVSEFVKGNKLAPGGTIPVERVEDSSKLTSADIHLTINKESKTAVPEDTREVRTRRLNEIIEKFGSVQPGKFARQYAEQKLLQIGSDLGYTAITSYPIENLLGDGRSRYISVVWLDAQNEIQVGFQIRKRTYDLNVIRFKDQRKLTNLKAKEKYIVNVSEADGTAHFFNFSAHNDQYYQCYSLTSEKEDLVSQTAPYSISKAKQISHANQRWTPEEETQLREGFAQKLTIGQLAKKHQRTRGAIQARLAQMGLIDFNPFFMRKKKQSN